MFFEFQRFEKKKGTMIMATTDNLAVVAWKINKVVTLASNSYAIHPISNLNRVAKIDAERKKITVTCPSGCYVQLQYQRSRYF